MHVPTVALGAVAALALAVPASLLHTHLVKAEPGIDATITESPKQVRLWFNEKPELALTGAALMKEDHSPVAAIKFAATDDSLSVAGPLSVALAPGRYMVMWRTASADGHAIRGSYFFTLDSASQPKP